MELTEEKTIELKVVIDNFKPEKSPDGLVHLPNKHLTNLESDTLYHLYPLDTKSDLEKRFGDVKFVAMGGAAERMHNFALLVAEELGIKDDIVDITKDSGRYSMFKVGPVLSVSHGMGVPSLSILLHEIIKLVHYAKCKDVVFFRIGTSGGIGVPQGTVVISDNAVDEQLRPYYILPILGKTVLRPAKFDQDLISELKSIADSENTPYQTVLGTTMCARDFYEAQSRLDGAFCNFTLEEKMNRLKEISEAGVVNIEMEATAFASMCRYAGIPGAIVCVTLLNRLEGDQVNTPKTIMKEIQQRPQQLVLKFIRKRLGDK